MKTCGNSPVQNNIPLVYAIIEVFGHCPFLRAVLIRVFCRVLTLNLLEVL